MFVLLHHEDDADARMLGTALARAGSVPVMAVTIEALVSAPLLTLGLSLEGARARATLADGRRVDSRRSRGLINRAADFPATATSRAIPADRAYTDAEWRAVLSGWITAFPRVLNRPAGMSLSGPSLHPLAWEAAAAAAGLRVSGLSFTEASTPEPAPRPSTRHLVVGRHVLGAAAPGVAPEALRALAHLTGHDLLEVFHRPGPTGPVFDSASPRPTISYYPGALRALDRTLAQAVAAVAA